MSLATSFIEQVMKRRKYSCKDGATLDDMERQVFIFQSPTLLKLDG